ncbi:PhnD/SsuA/transferrin family substrate-binding protein [Amphritea sp. 2_MG-2023]|uniref:PhnD/SsuA/transferrin family substrate-binding protein n=1 Tax=Amphritea TaxID=515417 RepID=UPI001C072751|nr:MULTISPECIES: PhnD/SsuA/transferrin family substrate-binding protein [Amphritea]MBU2967457.1 PhnD/SsuA/transferrin family substrate-binding protein [Amphritea atlantica]MDO6418288.1 PhnD/SsuA/transferrin family substrate-binding protein [Amphritea sp. 2_MG-2023]
MNKPQRAMLKSLSIGLLLGLLGWSTTASAEIKLSFGVYTADKPTVVVKTFKPLLKLLERSVAKSLGEPVKIKLQVASTYAGGIDDISTGKVDFSRLGPASYIKAKSLQPDIHILALEAKNGQKLFSGVIAVGTNSSVSDIADLKGKRFAFGDERSTIGRYLAQQHLFEQQLRAGDLAYYEYLGRHDKVGAAVASGQFDAGALKQSTYKRLVDNGAALRVLATFNNVTKPWIARAGLDEQIVSALKECLLEITDPMALEALQKDGFVEGSDNDYAIIRRAIDQNPQFFE